MAYFIFSFYIHLSTVLESKICSDDKKTNNRKRRPNISYLCVNEITIYHLTHSFSCDTYFLSVTFHLVGVVMRAPPGQGPLPLPLHCPPPNPARCPPRWPPHAVLSCPLIQSGSRTIWWVAAGVGTTLASRFLVRPA